MPRGRSPYFLVEIVFNNLPLLKLCTVIVLSASLVTIISFPLLLNSIPSVSGPPIISLTFLPFTKSTTAIRAGIFGSSLSSSSLPATGGLPVDAGSVDTKTCPLNTRTNSGFLPTEICFTN